MDVRLSKVGKKFNRNWIFRKVDHVFEQEKAYAILGRNGSGKSTLLQVISGFVLPSEGDIAYLDEHQEIQQENIFKHIALAAPYLDLHEEFTLMELLQFYGRFRRFRKNMTETDIIGLLDLEEAKDQSLKNFSSGMIQRVKLGLAILSDTPVLLLDEPATNLDETNIKRYQGILEEHRQGRVVLIASNEQEEEYGMCEEIFRLEKKRLKQAS